MTVPPEAAFVDLFPENEGPAAPMFIAPEVRWPGFRLRWSEEAGSMRIEVELEPETLQVTSEAISPEDRRRIELLIRESLLLRERFPIVRFTGSLSESPGSVKLAGDVEIRGQRQAVELDFRERRPGVWHANGCIHQTAFGIRPASAFMGALRSADCIEFEVCIDVGKLA